MIGPMLNPKPELLVDPQWLEANLANPKVRVFDCTLTRVPQPDGASLWESGRAAWESAHIPGALFLHMVDDLSAPTATVPYGLPDPDTVGELLSSLGVSGNATIVLYGDGSQSVIHRIWWVLTASGWPDVRVLDGGWQRWRAEDRPIESDAPTFAPACENPRPTPRPEMKIERDAVAAALGDPGHVLVHSLTAAQYAGSGGQVYGRPGRIPGSINIPAATLLDPDTGRFHPVDVMQTMFSAAGLRRAREIIPYCGGGIAATTVFLGLAVAGYENVRLYDGSLLDWTADPDAPMATGTSTTGA